MSKHKFSFRIWRNKYILLFVSLILCFSILTPVNAHYLANNQSVISQNNTSQQKPKRRHRRGYEIPPNVTPIKSNTTIRTKRTGFCKQKSDSADPAINSTILAHKYYPGFMTLENPTLIWYVPHSKSYPIDIAISRFGEYKPFYLTNMGDIQSKQGINKYILPKAPELQPNQRYTWKVKIYCDATNLSNSYEDKSTFTLIEMPSNLKRQIQLSNDPLDKAEIYAAKGIWYDAFTQTLQSHDSDEQTREYQRLLLRNLAEKDGSKDLQKQLQEIIKQINV